MAVAVVGAAPASAHGSPDATAVPSGNYRTELTGPAWPDIHVQMVDNSDRVEIRNDSPLDVIVLGYDGEPYLRIGQQGAFENLQSPATYLNRTVSGNAPIPSGLDPDGPPLPRPSNSLDGQHLARRRARRPQLVTRHHRGHLDRADVG
jgi:hypothetical protein